MLVQLERLERLWARSGRQRRLVPSWTDYSLGGMSGLMGGNELGEVHFRQGFMGLGEGQGGNVQRTADGDKLPRQGRVTRAVAKGIALSRLRLRSVGMIEGAVPAVGTGGDGFSSRRKIAAEAGRRERQHQQDHQKGDDMSKRWLHWVPWLRVAWNTMPDSDSGRQEIIKKAGDFPAFKTTSANIPISSPSKSKCILTRLPDIDYGGGIR